MRGDGVAGAQSETARREGEVLRLDGVGYRTGGRPLLEGVDLAVAPGDCLGLIGPNGAGKTTLLRLAAGLLTPTSGGIRLGDRPLDELGRREIARRLGYVPQRPQLDAAFSVRAVVLTGRTPHPRRFQLETAADRRIADEALARADLVALAERPVTALSGGERQRVAIARALAQRPRLLLLDEPTASLDLRHQHEIMALAAGLARDAGLAVLVSAHDLNLAARYCDRLAVLDRGRLVAEGAPIAVLTPALLAAVFGVEASVAVGDGPTPTATVTVHGALVPGGVGVPAGYRVEDA